MKKNLISLIFLCGFAFFGEATEPELMVRETIVLKNGNTYSGRIGSQSTDGQIVFLSDTSTVYIPTRYIVNPDDTEGTVDIYLSYPDSLTCYKDLFDRSVVNEIVTTDTVDTHRLNNLLVLKGVQILELGEKRKVLDPNYKEIVLNLSDIEAINRTPVNPKLKNWMFDDMVTDQGVYTGQIRSIEPGKFTKIATNDDKLVNVSNRSLKIQRRTPYNGLRPIIEQVQILDNVYFIDGKSATGGIIVEQNFENGSFVYADNANGRQVYRLKDVDRIVKSVNASFKPEYTFDFDPDSLYINRQPILFYLYKDKKDKLEIDTQYAKVQVIKSEDRKLNFENKDNPNFATLNLLRCPITILDNKLPTKIPISKADIFDRMIPYQTLPPTEDGTLTRLYSLPEYGYYILINPFNSTIALLKIEK